MHGTRHTHTDEPRTARRPWLVLILLCAAQFMVVLDMTVANVALPSIAADLDFAAGDLQWVITAYLLFTGGLLLLGGRTADLLGHRRVFLTGLLVFTAASLASGLAPSPAALIAARAAQGLGAALLTPGALSIITTTYVGEQRTAALSAWGAIASAGAAAGVLLGGILTSWLGWRSVFLINVPIGTIAGALALHRIAPVRGVRRRLDVPGAASVVAGLVVLVYAIEGTAAHGWGSARTLVLLALAAGLLATFAAVERAAPQPLVPPPTWRVRSLVAGAVLMLGSTGILVGTFFLTSLYLQDVLDDSALETGLAFLPLMLAIGLASHVSPRLLVRAGSRVVAVTGLALIAAGALVLAGAPDRAAYASDLLPGLLVIGVGIGLVFPAASVTAMSDVDADGAGLASGLMSTSHELGAALGVAVLSAVAGATPAGFGDAFLVAALIAVGIALAGLRFFPSVRPRPGVRVAVH
jgi:EmrB/QacA subfamily drug resistance transporter